MIEHPKPAEVAALLREAYAINAVPDTKVRRWMDANGYATKLHAQWGSVVALPESAPVPRWARTRTEAWPRLGLRLLAPLCDARGLLRSVVAQSVSRDRPGAASPANHGHDALVVACPTARRAMIARKATARVVVTGTFRAWLRCAEAMRSRGEETGVWGLLPRAWSPSLANVLGNADVTLIECADAGHLALVRGALEARAGRTSTNLTMLGSAGEV